MKKKQDKPFAFRGKYLLLFVIIFYSVFFLLNSQSAWIALQKSFTVLIKILPIFAGVILFTALLNFFLKPNRSPGTLDMKVVLKDGCGLWPPGSSVTGQCMPGIRYWKSCAVTA